MRKEDKAVIIAQLTEALKSSSHFYLVDVEGMNAEQTSAMRRKCFENELKMVVCKNTLLHKSLEACDTDFEPMYGALKGTTAVIFTEVANKPAKLLKEFASKKMEKPSLKAAYAEETLYVGAEHLNTLVALKSKNELIADVIAALESPIMNVLSALENKEGEAAAAE